MAITYNWDCRNVEVYASHTDLQQPANTRSNVIFNVYWSLEGVDSEKDSFNLPYTAQKQGICELNIDNLSNFTSLSDVTNLQCSTWVQNVLGSSEIIALKDDIAKQINSAKNPEGDQIMSEILNS